jgi:hypothetical protein
MVLSDNDSRGQLFRPGTLIFPKRVWSIEWFVWPFVLAGNKEQATLTLAQLLGQTVSQIRLPTFEAGQLHQGVSFA